ncbi:MAG: lysozyme [Micrococcales bacterium]|nr:lysozyme [Micrococcales bacterium]
MKGAKVYIIGLIIAKFEGLRLRAYKDSGGIWTIGYGTTINPETGLPIKQGDVITKAKALEWLKIQTASVATRVKALLKRPVTENQLAALTSLAYNIGLGAFGRSTLLRKLNAGESTNAVAAEFLRWNKVNKVEVPGLTNRRKLEAELFLS